MGYTVERNGFVSMETLGQSLLSDLVSNGFSAVEPNTIGTDTYSATIAATDAVDPLLAGGVPAEDQQPWRIRVACTADEMRLWASSPNSLDDLGNTFAYDGDWESGELAHSIDGANRYFCKRNFGSGDETPEAHPMSYRVSITDRGVALILWQEGSDREGNRFSWFVIQRPVDNTSGAVLETGKAPLFCVYSVYGQKESSWRFTVREKDVTAPVKPTPAGSHTEDSGALINFETQVTITEGNNYILTFPNGLNTQRYMYMEELDMIAFTSADVISQWSDVALSVYGEGTDRKYKSCHANGENNTKMRILLLTEGGGI
jgi:hypothetical protein